MKMRKNIEKSISKSPFQVDLMRKKHRNQESSKKRNTEPNQIKLVKNTPRKKRSLLSCRASSWSLRMVEKSSKSNSRRKYINISLLDSKMTSANEIWKPVQLHQKAIFTLTKLHYGSAMMKLLVTNVRSKNLNGKISPGSKSHKAFRKRSKISRRITFWSRLKTKVTSTCRRMIS